MNVHGDGKRRGRITGGDAQMTLFELKDDALRAEIASLDVDSMTPLEALQALALLRRTLSFLNIASDDGNLTATGRFVHAALFGAAFLASKAGMDSVVDLAADPR